MVFGKYNDISQCEADCITFSDNDILPFINDSPSNDDSKEWQ